jgi:chromatin assembly factor 1 subunit A
MIKYKNKDYFIYSKGERRKRCIIIEDSFIKYFGYFDKTSYLLNPRNPLKKDETVIDYDMSSEEEWNEQNGEDVDAPKQDDDEDDEVEKILKEEGEEEGFIVPDDYLSASEMNLS